MYHETFTEVVERKCVFEKTTCDACGRILKIGPGFSKSDNPRERYCDVVSVEVTCSHNDWGNDSVDSFERMDYCIDCFKKVGYSKVLQFVGENYTPTVEIKITTEEAPECVL